MNIQNLSDNELSKIIPEVCRKERLATVDVLCHLLELDSRKLYLKLGYSSLFDYCTRKLKYSEGAANRRIKASRFIKDNLDAKDKLISGELSLCTIAIAATTIGKGEIKLNDISNKSKREVEVLLSKASPKIQKPREVIKPVAVKREILSIVNSPPPEVEERYEIRFSLAKEQYNALQDVKYKMSNILGANLSIEKVVERLIHDYLNPKTRKSEGSQNSSRYISIMVKREVNERDNNQCTYVSKDGVRCDSKCYLQYDHKIPYALGGGKDTSNSRLMCASHNQLLAKECF